MVGLSAWAAFPFLPNSHSSFNTAEILPLQESWFTCLLSVTIRLCVITFIDSACLLSFFFYSCIPSNLNSTLAHTCSAVYWVRSYVMWTSWKLGSGLFPDPRYATLIKMCNICFTPRHHAKSWGCKDKKRQTMYSSSWQIQGGDGIANEVSKTI